MKFSGLVPLQCAYQAQDERYGERANFMQTGTTLVDM